MSVEFVCICGHPKDHHEFLSTYSGDPIDDDESWCATNLDLTCECSEFIPDNLKTLEHLSVDNPSL